MSHDLCRMGERTADERLAGAVAATPDGGHATGTEDAAPAAVGERVVLLAASDARAGRGCRGRRPAVRGRPPAGGR